jgi:sulfite exporter TauE/SafE
VSPLVVSAFLMGLFGGVHCVAMCGGVVGVLCTAAPRCPTASIGRAGGGGGGAGGGGAGGGGGGRSRLAQVPYWLGYNGGRIASYTLLGTLFGSLGTLSTGVFPLEPVRFGLRALAALCMLAVGLHLAGLPSVVKGLESVGAPLWRRLTPLTKRVLPLRSPWQAVVLGGLWGMMPCGLLYGALALAASAESPSEAAMTMGAFGLATLPVMLTMSAVAQSVAQWLARAWVRRLAGVLVLAFGLWSTAGVAAQVGLGAPFGIAPAPTGGAHACCPKR